jgi:hypothetical protein
VILDTFHWSGKNSFVARSRAAEDFRNRLLETSTLYPDARQVVIAHSHGGTVVAEALAGTSTLVSRVLPPLAALICMATPFVYQIPREGRGRFAVCMALASVLTGIIALMYLFTGALTGRSPPLIVAAHSAIFLAATVFSFALYTSSGRARDFGLIPYTTPVYILRSTRDEASLSIGLTQTLHWVTGLFYKPSTIGVAFLFPFALTPALMYIASVLLPQATALDALHLFISCFFISQSILPGIYLAGVLCVAIATGAWSPRHWMKQIIEMEPTPVGHTCAIKSYRDSGTLLTGLRVFKTGGMRHSQLYDQDEVHWNIGYILDDVLEGVRPTLINTGYEIGQHPRHL